MKTRTFVLSGELQKSFCTAVLSMKGENSLFCNLHSYSKLDKLVKIAIKVGEVEYYAEAIDLSLDYHFIVEGAKIEDDVKICVLSDGEAIMSNGLSLSEIDDLKRLGAPNDENFEAKKVETQSQNEEKREELPLTDGETTFFDAIAPQFDEPFKDGEHCVEIEALIPNSSWVWVQGEENFKYVLGKIFENDELKYVCYAEQSSSVEQIPNSVDPQYAQWLPIEPENEKSKGFYVMYQDAKSGETVKFD